MQEHGVEPEIIRYLDTPPSLDDLRELSRQLSLRPVEMLRQGEAEWKASGLDAEDTDDETLFRWMANHPVLIQRPIVVAGDKARIGRPPEAVLEILS